MIDTIQVVLIEMEHTTIMDTDIATVATIEAIDMIMDDDMIIDEVTDMITEDGRYYIFINKKVYKTRYQIV